MKRLSIVIATALLVTGCAVSQPETAGPIAPPPAPKPWGWGYSDKAKVEMAKTFGTTSLKASEFRWVDDIPKTGETKVVVSLTDQMAWVYRGDRMIAATTVSSGKLKHESPMGQFPIMEKKAFHRSNRYSNAPMPHMLRLNRWGVALHGGVVPGYPASHGCIRLPVAFAKKLFGYVSRGDNVYVEG